MKLPKFIRMQLMLRAYTKRAMLDDYWSQNRNFEVGDLFDKYGLTRKDLRKEVKK